MEKNEEEDVQMKLLNQIVPADRSAKSGENSKLGSVMSMRSEVYVETNQPKAPDGGWGWMVVIGAFFTNFIVDGIMYTFDIMRPTLVIDFPEIEPWEIQVMGSLIPGLYLSLAPFTGALMNMYGARPLVVTGGILGCIAFFASAFCENFYMLLFMYGIVGGISFAMILAVGFYFDKKRATATGIAVCGSSFGTFILASLMTMLYEEYGSWRGVLIICSGLLLNCCVCGALFRPLPELVLQQVVFTENDPGTEEDQMQQQQFIMQKIIEEKRRQRAISKGSLDNCVITKDNRVVRLDSQMSFGHRTPAWRPEDTADRLGIVGAAPGNFAISPSPSYDGVRRARTQSFLTISRSNYQSQLSIATPGLTIQKMSLGSGMLYRQDAYFTGNIQHTNRYREAQAVAAATGADVDTVYAQSVMNIPADDGADGIDDGETPCCAQVISSKSIRDGLLNTFDISLMTSPTMIVLCIAALIGMIGFFTPYFFSISFFREALPDHKDQAVWVLHCIAFTNAPGRILCGILSDQPWADSLVITNVAMILSGVLNAILPFIAHWGPWVFYTYGVLFGLIISPFISLRSIIVADLLGIEKLTSAYGILLLFMGAAAFIGSPVLAGIQQQTQSFTFVFILSGIFLAISGVICIPCHRLAAWEKRRAVKKERERKGQNTDPTPLNTPAELISDNRNATALPTNDIRDA